MHEYGSDKMSGWGGMWFAPIFMALVPVAFIFLVVWIVRAGSSTPTNTRNRTALQLLDERYAKDEINNDEYEQCRSALER